MFLRTCDSRPVWKPSPPGAPSPVEKSLREAFDQVDRTALEQRQRHPRTTRRTANCAMIALILAVTLLSFAEFSRWFGHFAGEEGVRLEKAAMFAAAAPASRP